MDIMSQPNREPRQAEIITPSEFGSTVWSLMRHQTEVLGGDGVYGIDVTIPLTEFRSGTSGEYYFSDDIGQNYRNIFGISRLGEYWDVSGNGDGVSQGSSIRIVYAERGVAKYNNRYAKAHISFDQRKPRYVIELKRNENKWDISKMTEIIGSNETALSDPNDKRIQSVLQRTSNFAQSSTKPLDKALERYELNHLSQLILGIDQIGPGLAHMDLDFNPREAFNHLTRQTLNRTRKADDTLFYKLVHLHDGFWSQGPNMEPLPCE